MSSPASQSNDRPGGQFCISPMRCKKHSCDRCDPVRTHDSNARTVNFMTSKQHFESPRPRQILPLQNYAAVGDGRSVALIGLDGSVGWWCVPTLDSAPLFDALLDSEHGGFLALHPTEPFQAEHRYREGSNVLETTFTTASGVVRITDSMNSSFA